MSDERDERQRPEFIIKSLQGKKKKKKGNPVRKEVKSGSLLPGPQPKKTVILKKGTESLKQTL